MNYFFSLQEFQSCPLTIASPKTEKILNRFRGQMQKMLPSMIEKEGKLWKESNQVTKNGVKIPLEKYTCAIPRIQNILSTWNITAEEDFNTCENYHIPYANQTANLSDSGFVNVTIHSANEAIQSTSKNSTGSFSSLSLKAQLGELSSSDHILFYFWGGGMTAKCDDGKDIILARTLMNSQMEHLKREKNTNNGIR